MPIEELLTNVNSLTWAISTSRMCSAAMTATAGSRSSGMCRSFAKWFNVPTGSTPSAAVDSTRADATLLTVPSPPAATTMAARPLAVRAAAAGSSPSPSTMTSTSRPAARNTSTSSVARCGRPLAVPARAFTMTTIAPASGIRVHRSRILLRTAMRATAETRGRRRRRAARARSTARRSAAVGRTECGKRSPPRDGSQRRSRPSGDTATRRRPATSAKCRCAVSRTCWAVEKWMKPSRRSTGEPANAPAASLARHKTAGTSL